MLVREPPKCIPIPDFFVAHFCQMEAPVTTTLLAFPHDLLTDFFFSLTVIILQWTITKSVLAGERPWVNDSLTRGLGGWRLKEKHSQNHSWLCFDFTATSCPESEAGGGVKIGAMMVNKNALEALMKSWDCVASHITWQTSELVSTRPDLISGLRSYM